MNPPFSDRRDAEHVQHAYGLLKPGGRLVAIMGEGVFFGQDKKATAFRDWLDSKNGTSEKLEEGAFLDPSLPVNTGTAARMVVIDKTKETDQGTALFSRSTPTAGLSTDEVRAIIAPVLAKWKNAPPINVVETSAQVPEMAAASGVEGAYLSDGTVYLVADNLPNGKRVMEVLAHEAIGHAGMEAVFGADYDAIIKQVQFMEATAKRPDGRANSMSMRPSPV